jgi:hypothetical protein
MKLKTLKEKNSFFLFLIKSKLRRHFYTIERMNNTFSKLLN